MSKKQDRIVYKNQAGNWVNKLIHGEGPSSVHDTQKEAIDAARKMLEKAGGGELTIQGEDGKFRDKHTIAPGNDPHPPKG